MAYLAGSDCASGNRLGPLYRRDAGVQGCSHARLSPIMGLRRWWSRTVEPDTPAQTERQVLNLVWVQRLRGAGGRMHNAIEGGSESAGEPAAWNAFLSRVFTLGASALGLSFLSLQIDDAQRPELIRSVWTLLGFGVLLLLVSMVAGWLARYLTRGTNVIIGFAIRCGSLDFQGTVLPVGGRGKLALFLSAVAVAASWSPALVKLIEKPAALVGVGLLLAAAVPFITFARANV